MLFFVVGSVRVFILIILNGYVGIGKFNDIGWVGGWFLMRM